MIYRPSGWTLGFFFKKTIAAQSHFIAFLCAIAGMAYLFLYARGPWSWLEMLACSLFGLCGILVFAMSSLYHFLTDGLMVSPRLRHWLRNFDHFAIYLFIAASYTVVLIRVETGFWKTLLTVGVWLVAMSGIVYTALKHRLPSWAQHRIAYTAGFVAMGWMALPRIGFLFSHLSVWQTYFLIGAGASYLVGAIVYATKRPNLVHGVFGFHELWHLFVMSGYGFQYFLVYGLYCS